MNRSVTNIIRFFLDECVPPLIRDSKFFMYPFYLVWFKGSGINFIMNFKSHVNKLSEEEFQNVYRELKTLAVDRPTDLNLPSVNYMLKNLEPTAETMLDVGCGRGYWLNKVAGTTPGLKLTGCDLYDNVLLNNANYAKANIENLPFADKTFDIVTCHHTIEHVRNLEKAISELRRVTKQQLIIATPCQRYYYYTLDLHIHFFPEESSLENVIRMKHFSCKKLSGDWVYIGSQSKGDDS